MDVGFLDSEYYQVAVVGRKVDGICVWWRVRRLVSQPPAVVEEVHVALEGVLLAMEMGWEEVVLEGDYSQIITAIQNRVDDPFM